MEKDKKVELSTKNRSTLIVLLKARVKEIKECIEIEKKYDKKFLGYLDKEFIDILKKQKKEATQLIKTLEDM